MIILSGMSCAGKDTVLKELLNLGMKPVISYTTRDKRPSETDDVEYHFISDEDFEQKNAKGFFAETTKYNTVNGIKKYGSAVDDLSDDKAIILNPEGVNIIKSISELNPVVFYVKADEQTIRERLSIRGDDMKEAERRLEADKRDFRGFDDIADYIVFSDNDSTPVELAKLILEIYRQRQRKENA